MVNEAIKVEGPYEVMDYTCADATAINQYTLCQMTDPRTASASSADGQVFAGIAATDKEASDGQTNLGLYNKGIFVLYASAAIAVGARVSLSGANTIKTATEAEIAAGKDFGVALEAFAGSDTGEVKVLK